MLNLEIYAKEFGSDDRNGKDAQTWRNRSIDWFNAERRFIFASDKSLGCNQWKESISLINQKKIQHLKIVKHQNN